MMQRRSTDSRISIRSAAIAARTHDGSSSASFIRRYTRRAAPAGILIALCASIVVLGFSGAAIAQDFTARVDRSRIAANETVTLEVVYADRADTSSIDFESLLPDFSILSNRPSSQTRIINLRRSSQTSWQLTLMPRRTGSLRIPSFRIGAARTQPIDILVSDALGGPEEGAPFSARVEVDRESAFIGEQILVRVLLTIARDISDLRGAPLEIPGAESTLVKQSEFQRVIEGVPYQVTELAYAVFSQSPGPLEVPSLQYTGAQRRQHVVFALTEAKTIEILDPLADPVASQKRPWLPADAVAVASEWSGPTDSLVVGEPITRTLRIAAASQHAAAIAPITLPDGPYKQYSEQPVIEDTETSTGILGRRTDSIVVVPTEQGEIRLPAIEIDWWNINAREWQIARIPSETIHVIAGASLLDDPAAASPAQDSVPTTPDSEPSEGTRVVGDRLSAGLALLCAVLLLSCIGLIVRVRRLEAQLAPHDAFETDRFDVSPSARAAYHRALRSLSKRDLHESRRDLIAWARLEWPEDKITRLEQIGARTQDVALRAALVDLDAALYRPAARPSEPSAAQATTRGGNRDEHEKAFDFEDLKARVERLHQEVSVDDAPQESALDPLYPIQS